MGCNSSKPNTIADVDGDGKDFLDRYSVGEILGQGEFGVVKIIYDKDDPAGAGADPLACKILRKGMQFKDNTLLSAIKPKVLKLECEILRTLAGKHYNLKLKQIYESPSAIYIVTEHCSGGDMFHYVADNYGGDDDDGLRTEDVSRISFQLLDAVSHCAKHDIMHRDIKPENIMFKESKKGSPLQLIDFGSGTMTSFEEVIEESNPKPCEQADGSMLSMLNTFAGSAFYISPEMFKRKYTCKTDVWSAGVTIYVLVAGYPAMNLQEAFNMLQNSEANTIEERIEKLKQLPNMPDMPDTFFELLSKCLTYRHKQRTSAEQILDAEFVRFHHEHEMEKEEDRTTSKLVQGAALRHIENRLYAVYERGITALMVSILKRKELKLLLESVDALIASSPESHMEEGFDNKKKLQIVLVEELYDLLKKLDIENDKDQLFKMMDDLSHEKNYKKYAYHVAILRQFYTFEEDDNFFDRSDKTDELDNSMSRKLNKAMLKHGKQTPTSNSDDFNPHLHSAHGNNFWDAIKKEMNAKKDPKKNPTTNELNMTSHF